MTTPKSPQRPHKTSSQRMVAITPACIAVEAKIVAKLRDLETIGTLPPLTDEQRSVIGRWAKTYAHDAVVDYDHEIHKPNV